jgi:hypothetical protein
MVDFGRFFRRPAVEELDVDSEILNQANELLDFSSTVYYSKFLEYLDKESSRPLKVGDHMDMIQSAVRANTLREIRDTLVRRVANARSAAMQTEDE